MSSRLCLACDLEDDAAAIAAYENWHRVGSVPAAVLASIRHADVEEMEIFRIGHRLVMMIDVNENFSFERKAAMDAANPGVAAWEEQMLDYQRPLPQAVGDEKWLPMARIFRLSDHPDAPE